MKSVAEDITNLIAEDVSDVVKNAQETAKLRDELEGKGFSFRFGQGVTIRGKKTYDVKDVLKKYGFKFMKTPDASWERKGLDVDYLAMYRDMSKALTGASASKQKEPEGGPGSKKKREETTWSSPRIEEMRTLIGEDDKPKMTKPVKVKIKDGYMQIAKKGEAAEEAEDPEAAGDSPPGTITLMGRAYKVVKKGKHGYDLRGPRGAQCSLVQNVKNPKMWALVTRAMKPTSMWFRQVGDGDEFEQV